ncbi:MAG: copper resistance protein CopC [Micrococcales bacterium]|nr:copper resistance protein CopC [Micrococcales bacterium]OJX66185.1 MAG: hypothetical protein BGO94_04540 [Micrococcales bacterium 72-143]
MTRALRALAAAASVVAAGAALALVAAPAAEAHSVLVASTPEAGVTLAELPAEFSVTMNETLLSGAGDAAFALRVRSSDGLYYGDGCLTIVDATVSTPAAIGPAGDYTLEWQVVSADGHPVGGEIPFTWTGEATADGATEPAACGGAVPNPGTTTGPDDGSGHHGDTASEIPLGDVLWIVGAVLVVALAVTGALIATRRRPGT